DDRVDLAAVCRVAELDDAGARLDQAAQLGALDHDLGVVAGVRGGGDHVDEVREIGAAAHPGELAALGELVRDGDQVSGFAAPVQVDDRFVDHLVRGAVEVVAAHRLDDVGDRVLGQHHAAEHAALGGEILRRGAFQAAVGSGFEGFGGCHRASVGTPPAGVLTIRPTGDPGHVRAVLTALGRRGRSAVSHVRSRGRGCGATGWWAASGPAA